ncbi:adenylate kinase-domain-containing protein [Colletotrichum acutatum]|uniref:Adenylate kinase-domain-containing protein n=1 Tax=Glomerella acutata TaxID=27357 RepID=A0AAD8X9U9_GLOAC|nr:adenylate kinase-domain-containing protein [Colletotrichum acutatum]KAK1708903.1 adenylate kinase-domain-containing protein [Colletotrichum acutatum]
MPVVISILGRPGSEKGTQCRLLSQKFRLSHISIGDVLREEMERGEESPHADIIRANMLAGKIGPIEITMAILKNRITKLMEGGTQVFILDGFPRSIEQSTHFQTLMGPIKSLLVLQCSPETSFHRLLPRGRFDDQTQAIRNRLLTFETTTSLVVDDFRKHKKLTVVDAEPSVAKIHEGLVTIVSSVAELLH